MGQLKRLALRKMPKFHLISWFGNFVERHIFTQNFHTRKLDVISVFYAMWAKAAKIRSLHLGRTAHFDK